jgi:hypothetical protein
MLGNGTSVVKRLIETVGVYGTKFSEEIRCLMKEKHKNLALFLGYYSDTQGKMVDCKGELVLADVRHKLLYFEYLPKRNLYKQITGKMMVHVFGSSIHITEGSQVSQVLNQLSSLPSCRFISWT